MSQQRLEFPKNIFPIIFIGVLALIFLSKSTVTIEAGEAGVLWKRFSGGVVTDEPALGEGFHFVAPWNKVIIYEVRQQELTEKMK
ncbi:MAG: SPFH domain-containing protein, partial [Lutimonas sp.]